MLYLQYASSELQLSGTGTRVMQGLRAVCKGRRKQGVSWKPKYSEHANGARRCYAFSQHSNGHGVQVVRSIVLVSKASRVAWYKRFDGELLRK